MHEKYDPSKSKWNYICFNLEAHNDLCNDLLPQKPTHKRNGLGLTRIENAEEKTEKYVIHNRTQHTKSLLLWCLVIDGCAGFPPPTLTAHIKLALSMVPSPLFATHAHRFRPLQAPTPHFHRNIAAP